MSLERKLKPDRNMIGPLVPMSMILVFSLSTLVFGLPTGMTILAIIAWGFALFYLLVVARTGNLPHLFVMAYAIFLGLIIYLVVEDIANSGRQNLELRVAWFTGIVFFGICLGYLLINRKLKWRGREIFELAASGVEEGENGYTARPRPVGKVDYSPQQVQSFARFLARHLVALPYLTNQNTTLVPVKMGDEYSRMLELGGDYRDASWINFAQDGEVSVHISQRDYLDYRGAPAFDALCAALGQLFVEFLELHVKGEGVRVIDRLDDLKLSVFS